MNAADLELLNERTKRLEELAWQRGLAPFKTVFHVVPSEILYEFGAYGMPGRFSHWSHGRDYFRMKTMYDLGVSKIYELVVNTDPAQAFLLANNTVTQNTFVVAHVYGHTDFFANNIHFAHTDRNMIDAMTLHAARLQEYRLRYGDREVERILDAALAIAPHVDQDVTKQIANVQETWRQEKAKRDDWRPERHEWADLLGPRTEKQAPKVVSPVPPIAGDDILYILSRYAVGLEEWQRDILDIVREEELYFQPQGRTKIFNEGWAVFWHLRLLRELEDITAEEGVEIASTHAAVACPHPGSLNPYYLGWQVLEAINRAHGGDEQSCADYLFELRTQEDDVSLLRNELTEEMVHDLDLLLFKEVDPDPLDAYIYQYCSTKEWEKVRDILTNDLSNHGRPRIGVASATFNNGELVLQHYDDGVPLDLDYAEKTLEYIERLWGRTVHLVTKNPVSREAVIPQITLQFDHQRKHRRVPGSVLD